MVGIGHTAPQLANELQEDADEWVEVNAEDLKGFDDGASTEAPKPVQSRIYRHDDPFKPSHAPHFVADCAKEVGEAMRNYGYNEIFDPSPAPADQSLADAAATGVARVSRGVAEYAAGIALGGVEIASRGTALAVEAVESGVEYVAPPVVSVAKTVSDAAAPLTAAVATAAPVVGSAAATMVTSTAGAVGAAYNYFFGQAPGDSEA